MNRRSTVLSVCLVLAMTTISHAAVEPGVELAPPPLVPEGQSLVYYAPYAPHHTPGDPSHEEHYFVMTGDLDHFAWFSATPATPGVITVKYDFRALNGFTNVITPGQKARVIDALNVWSAATGGKLVFVQDIVAPAADIVNIGTGDLAAVNPMFTSGPGGILGLGGGFFTHGGPIHLITSGVAWQDFAENWDETLGNGNPPGTFDYFTVAAQEIGHALGLGHTDNTGMTNLMNGVYLAEQTMASMIDIDHIQSVYGQSACSAADGENAVLSNDTILVPTVVEVCNQITLGPNFAVAGPNGDLTLRAGNVVEARDGFSVLVDGTLTIEIDPSL